MGTRSGLGGTGDEQPENRGGRNSHDEPPQPTSCPQWIISTFGRAFFRPATPVYVTLVPLRYNSRSSLSPASSFSPASVTSVLPRLRSWSSLSPASSFTP